jgi:hypothetical protein
MIFRPFDASVPPDIFNNHWVCFPVIPFQIGFHYPFPDLTTSFFAQTRICYIQAMPQLWRALFALEELKKVFNLSLNLAELAQLYDVRSHGHHYFLFKTPKGGATPIEEVTKNDGPWKKKYFLVKRSSIPGGDSLPIEWLTTRMPRIRARILGFFNLQLTLCFFSSCSSEV